MPGEANKDSTFVIRRISSEHSLQLNCPEASCEDTTIKSKDETYFFCLLGEEEEEEVLCFCNSATIHR
jgi:hypothetical protein